MIPKNSKMKIHELPYDLNGELCTIFDNNNEWKELAKLMKYQDLQIKAIENNASIKRTSPTSELLKDWGQYNHKASELFTLLLHMRSVAGLKCLLAVLDEPKYHKAYNTLCAKVATNDPKRPTADKNDQPQENNKSDTSFQNDGSSISLEIEKNVCAIPKIDYEDLKIATRDWDPENKLGYGGFACVYRGKWKQLPVAIKRLNSIHSASERELISELRVNQYRHDNIVPLYGYSYGGPAVCLVYQLMPGGSLDYRLHSAAQNIPLYWPPRFNIVLGVARGLQFLHTVSKTPLIHGDIKPANILLDQFLNPKIADFGLARVGPNLDEKSHIKVLHTHGTRPYLPLEYQRSGILSPAVDVYSFGVTLIEVATGLKAHDEYRSPPLLTDYIWQQAKDMPDLALLEDPRLCGTPASNPALCRILITGGMSCTQPERKKRTTMPDLYDFLQKMMNRWMSSMSLATRESRESSAT